MSLFEMMTANPNGFTAPWPFGSPSTPTPCNDESETEKTPEEESPGGSFFSFFDLFVTPYTASSSSSSLIPLVHQMGLQSPSSVDASTSTDAYSVDANERRISPISTSQSVYTTPSVHTAPSVYTTASGCSRHSDDGSRIRNMSPRQQHQSHRPLAIACALDPLEDADGRRVVVVQRRRRPHPQHQYRVPAAASTSSSPASRSVIVPATRDKMGKFGDIPQLTLTPSEEYVPKSQLTKRIAKPFPDNSS